MARGNKKDVSEQSGTGDPNAQGDQMYAGNPDQEQGVQNVGVNHIGNVAQEPQANNFEQNVTKMMTQMTQMNDQMQKISAQLNNQMIQFTGQIQTQVVDLIDDFKKHRHDSEQQINAFREESNHRSEQQFQRIRNENSLSLNDQLQQFRNENGEQISMLRKELEKKTAREHVSIPSSGVRPNLPQNSNVDSVNTGVGYSSSIGDDVELTSPTLSNW